MSLHSIQMTPIGYVRCTRSDPIDDDWDMIPSLVELDANQFDTSALAGIESFSHIEILFYFDQVPDSKIESGARHPRGRKDWPLVGIFAQRGKNRPNRIGSTVCRLMRVDGLKVHVQGLDAIDGSPVLDIKPVMKGFLPRSDVIEPTWAAEIMEQYWRTRP